MNKRLSHYQIFMIIMTTIMAGILLLMGVIAMNKSMTLKLKFDVNPNILCYIEYKLTSESDYKPLFCNVTNTGAELTPTVNDLATLSGNTLTLTQAFADLGPTMGASFDFKIYNYNNFKLKVTCGDASPKNTTANEGLENQPTTADPIIFTSITTGGGDIVFTFEEFVVFTVTFDFNNETGTSKTFEGTEFASTLTSDYIPQRNGYTFAGYYSGDVISPENLPNEENNTKYYDYSYLTNATTIQLNANAPALSESITLHARWLPFTINNYESGHVWEGYKYIEFENHATQEENYYISTAGDMPARWIIIGAGESVNSVLFDGVSRPSDVDTEKEAEELENNEVLLLSEYVLFQATFQDSHTSSLWGNSDLKPLLQSVFITNSGLSKFRNFILTKALLTSSSSEKTGDSTNDDIFLLACSFASGQNFCVQTYLGAISKTNPLYANLEGVNGGWWLRTGRYANKHSEYSAYRIYKNGTYSSSTTSDGGSAVNVNHPLGVRPCFVLNLA